MRIVIDLQGAQSASRFRGIGRYTMALVKEMARQRGGHEMLLVLNGSYADTIEPIRAAFADLLPADAIRVFEVAGPVGGHDPANDAWRKAAEAMFDAFMAKLVPDVIFISSLFEGSEAVTGVHSFQTAIPTAVVLYDLIPLIHRPIYLANPAAERWYDSRIGHLRRADLLLSISASSGQEAKDHLNVPDHAVVNISTACDDHFRPMAVSQADHAHLQQTYGIEKPFVMYTGDIDERKNIKGLFRAFAGLPVDLRQNHVLVLVGKQIAIERERFVALAQKQGLRSHELIFTGYVTDEELALLYNACTLFVFPSWHEGFGLPALEAMACGKAVIAANSSSLPEVIGREDALFAPRDDAAMAAKMAEVLGNPAFRAALERHGLEQAKKFSWQESARRAWAALEDLQRKTVQPPQFASPAKRPRLAFVSPLPPEKTGIADYSAELLPELARHYDITLIVAQPEVRDPWAQANAPVRDAAWLRANAGQFDRVMYHFGNSNFHAHMFDLLAEIPGVVVLHDFYLSGIVAHLDLHGQRPHGWARALLAGHGWNAVCERFIAQKVADTVRAYPCNLDILQQAVGVIVHAEFSRTLARQFYGTDAAQDWAVIPHLRQPLRLPTKAEARAQLGLAEDAFVVCSFGLLGPHKLNHRLLDAWLASPLATDPQCHLVFVGENHGGDYGQGLLRTMAESPAKARITITGWAEMGTFRTWLAAADVAVQLRTLSRGETSGTVLDCMNAGLPTIVNAHGSLAELPAQAVWLLPDEFTDAELAEALATLKNDAARRAELGTRAIEHIRTHHHPRRCADLYFDAIERLCAQASQRLPGLVQALPHLTPPLPAHQYPLVAQVLAQNFPPHPRRPQLLLDISALVQTDLWSGIERVTRALLHEIITQPPAGWQVEPVYATLEQPGYRYARRFMSRFLGIPDDWAEDAPVETWPGDVFLGLDLQPAVVPAQGPTLQSWHRRGVKVYFVVYDLLPVTLPEVFPEGAREGHQRWLETITRFDGALAISRAVADELHDWLQTFGAPRERPFALHWLHLGADTENSAPSRGLPADATETLASLRARPTFLMVGTIEPRKGYLQTLRAFDQLWARGIDINLVIVGKEGWTPLPDSNRRNIPETVNALRQHPERNQRLFWLEGISDEYLEKVYAASTCLIAASYDEGFGLPLIEAARHGLPLVVRDIPVFREVTAGHAYFFADSREPQVIAEAVETWLALYRQGQHPRSDQLPHQTWQDSAQQVLNAILHKTPAHQTWLPDGVRRYWGADPRLSTQVGKRQGRTMVTTGQAGHLIYGPYEHIEPGRYRVIVRGSADYFSGEEWLDIVCDQGNKKMAHFPLQEQGGCGVWQEMRGLDIGAECTDFEIRLWVTERTRLRLSDIELKKIDGTYDQKFVVMNKSYSKDLEWSLALYRSWSKYSVRKASFFVIVPRKDVANFTQRFADEMQCNRIAETPIILSEEDVLDVADIRLPPDMSGWHIQQIIKLCFSKTGFSRHYLTLDSAMIFTKPFDFSDLYSSEGIFYTAATRVRKDEFYGHYLQVDEKGWLNGELVNLSQSLEAICRFMGNKSEFTHWYIAANGFFDSECAKGLEAYARKNGIDGFVGLIRMAPYEFAWYGEYVFTQRQEQFMPKGPLIMLPCIELESLADFYEGNLQVPEHFYGVLFQPPASEHFDFKWLLDVSRGDQRSRLPGIR